MIEGNIIEPIEINPNPTEIVVNAVERDYLTADNNGNAREDQIGTGEAWDNQFWIVANRTLSAGETTIIQFKYKASRAAKTSTQCHEQPGNYIHYVAIGDVNFTEEWQDFETTFTGPSQCDGKDNANGYKNDFKSIAFNMAEIKEACDYEIKDVVWKLEDGTESLINQTGAENFFVKIGAGTSPYAYEPTAINSIVSKTDNGSSATYNLAGQRVDKAYKGIVVKNGKKMIVK